MEDLFFTVIFVSPLLAPLLVWLLWLVAKRLPKPLRTATFIVGTTLIATPTMIPAFVTAIPTTFIFFVLKELSQKGFEGFGDVAEFLRWEWAWQAPLFAVTTAIATLIAVFTYRERKPKAEASSP